MITNKKSHLIILKKALLKLKGHHGEISKIVMQGHMLPTGPFMANEAIETEELLNVIDQELKEIESKTLTHDS